MRSSSLVFLLVPLLLAAAAVAVFERREQHAAPPGSDAFYWKVGKFAVWIYSLQNGISPVLELELVVSASTRPVPKGHGVDYLLVLRVARLGTCEALVWGVPGEGSQEWKLKDFKQVDGA